MLHDGIHEPPLRDEASDISVIKSQTKNTDKPNIKEHYLEQELSDTQPILASATTTEAYQMTYRRGLDEVPLNASSHK